MTIIKRHFEDEVFAFREDGWISATIAAKRFEKEAYEWLKLPGTIRYIAALEKANESTTSGKIPDVPESFVTSSKKPVKHGGGIWIHPDLAIVFARWLSADFAVWCDKQIKEIISGSKPTFAVPTTLSGALRLAADQAEEIERQAEVIEVQQEQIEERQPAFDYVNKYIIPADGRFNITETAKMLNYPVREFTAYCVDQKIMHKTNNTYVGAEHLVKKGYLYQNPFYKNGVLRSQLFFTPEGFLWIQSHAPNRRSKGRSLFTVDGTTITLLH